MSRDDGYSSLSDSWLGQLINERYDIRETAATRDSVITYLAYDRLLQEEVALKRFLIPEMSAHFLVRFRAAAYPLGCLKLPRLVTVWDYGLVGDEAFLTMEWMTSPTLATQLECYGPVHPQVAVQIAIWLADALADLHERNLLHLGLNPGNIFLDAVYGLKLADVGLNRVVNDTGLTMTGASFARTLGYLAPEQLMYDALSEAVDVYALGVVIFELITGRLPNSHRSLNEHMAAFAEQMQHGPPLPSDFAPAVSEGLNTMVALCLQVDPARRPQNGRDLARRLREAVRSAPEPAVAYIARATSHSSSVRMTSQPPRARNESFMTRGLSQIGRMITGGPVRERQQHHEPADLEG